MNGASQRCSFLNKKLAPKTKINMPELAVVIPVFNHVLYTAQTIDTLIKYTKNNLTLIIVDDCSTDDTKMYCTEQLPDMFPAGHYFYHRNETNIGVNASWNAGLRTAMATEIPYICIANNDLLFTDGWDTPLTTVLNSDYHLVSPYSTEQKKPADFPAGKDRHCNPMGNLGILGACFMFKRELVQDIGFFPEAMRHYYGDNWILKMCELRGLKTGHVYDSYIHHLFCMTTSQLDNSRWFKEDAEAYAKYMEEFDLGIEDAFQFMVNHNPVKDLREAYYAGWRQGSEKLTEHIKE